MNVDKRNVEAHIVNNIIEKVMFNNELKDKVYTRCTEKYNIPATMVDDFLTMRIPLSEASEFILFAIIESYEIAQPKSAKLKEFYTEMEISTYSKNEYRTKELKFPLRFNMTQITDDQWIGFVDTKMLMELRRAQIVNYNENAQRALQKVIRGEKEYYKIAINNKAVEDIQEAMEEEIFIPNTITFNIPMETDYDFYYDTKNHEIVVRSLKHFDIIDGYHRYLSLGRANDRNTDFNYPMELRIVNWDEDKAKRFIFQEDQKTRMKKIDAATYDTTNGGNRVATRLNENSHSNLRGQILMSNGNISYAEFAVLVNYFYFKDIPKAKENAFVLSISNELMECWNMFTEAKPEYLDTKYNYKELVIIMYVFSKYQNQDKAKMCSVIEKMLGRISEIDSRKFHRKPPRKVLINDLDKLFGEVLRYV